MLGCHIAVFADLGNVREEILYNRTKTAVIGEAAEGGIVYNRFLTSPGITTFTRKPADLIARR